MCPSASRIASIGAGALAAATVSVAAEEHTGVANPAAAVELPTVEVIGTTPVAGIGNPVNQAPANVQSATAAELRAQAALGLADFMMRDFVGVAVNDVANNPFQPDVVFRGFTASPLLGTPQGISVYLDGVRVNEPFGDVVNWDLIPAAAISTITLLPGSNPAFGLNTLGGALSVRTKSGFQYPGISAEGYGGGFGRRAVELQAGGYRDRLDYFTAASLFREDGWRDNSPSDVRQLFGKLGWESEHTDVDISYTLAQTKLSGAGFSPQAMLAKRREAVFTPDDTRNRLGFVNAAASHFLTPTLLLAGNAYHRSTRAHTFNGDINDDYEEEFETLVGPGGDCETDPDPEACAAQALSGETARNNRTRTDQDSYGVTVQLTRLGTLLNLDNQLTTGVGYEASRSDFVQTEQAAEFMPDRRTVPTGAEEPNASFIGRNRSYGIYATDRLSLGEFWHLTLSARYNHTRVGLSDRLGTALNGRHRFERLNPAVGLNYTPTPGLTAYASYNEGSRAPTAIELGCADPKTPCKLPNAFASDPPLEQVVARTWEAGGVASLRTACAGAWRCSRPPTTTTFSSSVRR